MKTRYPAVKAGKRPERHMKDPGAPASAPAGVSPAGVAPAGVAPPGVDIGQAPDMLAA